LRSLEQAGSPKCGDRGMYVSGKQSRYPPSSVG
jgi:hypothetical protein